MRLDIARGVGVDDIEGGVAERVGSQPLIDEAEERGVIGTVFAVLMEDEESAPWDEA